MLFVVLFVAQIADYPPDSVANIPVNYTEALAGRPVLPGLLDGVRDAKAWRRERRPRILKQVEQNQFGRAPGRPKELRFEVFEKGAPALDDLAIRRQITVWFSAKHSADVLLYLPKNGPKRAPVLLHLGFTANSSTVDDPGIKPGMIWNAKDKTRMPASNGRAFGRINPRPLLAAGMGFATVYYGDIDPDFAGGWTLGVRGDYPEPGEHDWGTIAAWAWGASRILDYFETDSQVDAKRVALMGVSRLGKTVLWAGANDERFAAVIASCSGEGGAALSRRNYGETVKHLAVRYGYQFARAYAGHGDDPAGMPHDAHSLIALMAPRALLLQTGNTDKWSDPRGEFQAAVAATPVWRLFGKAGVTGDDVPAAGETQLNPLGWFMHAGGHGTLPADWTVFVEFLKRWL